MKKILFLLIATSVLYSADESKSLLSGSVPFQGDALNEYVDIRTKLLERERERNNKGLCYRSPFSETEDVRRALELAGEFVPATCCAERAFRWGLEHGIEPKELECVGIWGSSLGVLGAFISMATVPQYSDNSMATCMASITPLVCVSMPCAACALILSPECYRYAFPEIKRPQAQSIEIDDNEIREEM